MRHGATGNGVSLFKARTAALYNSRAIGHRLMFVRGDARARAHVEAVRCRALEAPQSE
jgi:hypothetical protein